MADEVIKACIDRILPDHLRIPAAQNAVKENPANAPATTAGLSIEEIAVFTKSRDETMFVRSAGVLVFAAALVLGLGLAAEPEGVGGLEQAAGPLVGERTRLLGQRHRGDRRAARRGHGLCRDGVGGAYAAGEALADIGVAECERLRPGGTRHRAAVPQPLICVACSGRESDGVAGQGTAGGGVAGDRRGAIDWGHAGAGEADRRHWLGGVIGDQDNPAVAVSGSVGLEGHGELAGRPLVDYLPGAAIGTDRKRRRRRPGARRRGTARCHVRGLAGERFHAVGSFSRLCYGASTAPSEKQICLCRPFRRAGGSHRLIDRFLVRMD